jgi:hypothetical protein
MAVLGFEWINRIKLLDQYLRVVNRRCGFAGLASLVFIRTANE